MFDESKKLGFGCLRFPHIDPDDETDVDMEELKSMVDAYIAGGFNYFDTAYPYLDYKSEIFVREALVERYDRNEFLLCTKFPCLEMKRGDILQDYFDEQLAKCGTDHFDFYLLHSLNKDYYKLAEELGCFDFLEKLKVDGLTKKTGISFHDTADVLDRILTEHPELDVVQIQLNYLDWDHEVIQSGKCYDVCRKHNKPIIVMEPVKGGTLAELPKEAARLMEEYRPGMHPAAWALRFAAGLPGVCMVLSGMSETSQVKANMELMNDPEPLDSAEIKILKKVGEILRASAAVPCTACGYCIGACPKQIPIPEYFKLYNENRRDGWQAETGKRYKESASKHANASECIGCGVCEKLCPQHIKISEKMKAVAEIFC